jgi:1-acyl-sn-glycerol-3-phosphate acyltransferase
MHLLYDGLKPIAGIALRWYYRSLVCANLERIPRDGPVFLAANHPNSLTDAMVVGWVSPRRVRYTAKSTLFANPLAARFLRAVGVIPLRRVADEQARADVSRNAQAFSAVADALAEHACVVIFPEGKTHDEPYMAPLRTGLARMALMARDERGVHGIRIVPIGLLFEEKSEPRTRILVQVGEPIDVDSVGDGEHTVAVLTELITRRLRAVTLNFESHADAERVQLLGETLLAITEPTGSLSEGAPPLARSLAVVRRIERAQHILRTQGDADVLQRIDAFELRLRAFRERLDALRLDVHDIGIDYTTHVNRGTVLRELAIASVMLPISFWGRVTHIVPIRLARAFALRNVQALDEPPMRTFTMGIALVLVTYLLLTTAVSVVFGPWWAVLFVCTLIPSASRSIQYSDRLERMRQRVRALRLFRRQPALQQALQRDAEALRAEAGALEQLAAVAGR